MHIIPTMLGRKQCFRELYSHKIDKKLKIFVHNTAAGGTRSNVATPQDHVFQPGWIETPSPVSSRKRKKPSHFQGAPVHFTFRSDSRVVCPLKIC